MMLDRCWQDVGMTLRIYVTGTLHIVGETPPEAVPTRVDERMLPGRQGRLVLAMLAVEHRRPVSRDELAEELWPDDLPAAWDVAVRAVISKSRAALERLGTPLIDGAFAAYRWRMPPDGWLDLDECGAAVHRAESALRAGDLTGAAGDGLVASVISGRPFLAGIDSQWVEMQRGRLREVRIRALDCTSEVWLQTGDPGEAARESRRILDLDPYHEPAIRRTMRSLMAAGDRAAAARAYQDFRQRVVEDLGVEPSDETLDLRRELLGDRQGADEAPREA